MKREAQDAGSQYKLRPLWYRVSLRWGPESIAAVAAFQLFPRLGLAYAGWTAVLLIRVPSTRRYQGFDVVLTDTHCLGKRLYQYPNLAYFYRVFVTICLRRPRLRQSLI